MKFQLLTVLALVAAAAASPVKNNNHDDVDVMIVPLETQLYDIDDGEGGFPGGFFSFNPFGNPFSGFMQSMDDMLKGLREQMTQVLQRLPSENTEWKEIGEGKGNTTSTTKVINGHKVTINETTYANEGDNAGTFFKIRVVDVHPTSEEDTNGSEEKVTSKPKLSGTDKDAEGVTLKSNSEDLEKGSPEILESANEIPRGKQEKEDTFSNEIELLGEDFKSDVVPEESIQNYKITGPEYTIASGEDLAEPIREIETNDVNSNFGYDLSNDIYVNQMLADANAPQNPDAELIDVDLINSQAQSQPLYRNDEIVPLAALTTYPDNLWPVYYKNVRS